ncbi:MAG TPA: alpha/beta hydrolase [Streptosporangiaceae bacterium]|nr:alpha/beta hydrolase [Streptosporangiaceae bacterium]
MLVLAACSAPATGPGGSPIPAGLQRFYDQKLHWGPCPLVVAEASGVAANAVDAQKAVAGFQCTTLTVPLDYAHPDGATIKLAMNRLPATDKSDRIGSLLTNPGGPGGSGLGFAFGARSFFTARLRARYDIVGLDPRGVGLSSPVECKITSQEQRETSALGEATALAQACQRTSGKILPYVGTDNAARDLDIARAALGEPKLDYYGASYGTLLGQVYAQMFPHNVGRMVLDSIDNPTGAGDPTAQAVSFETTFNVLIESCIERGGCPMGSSKNAILARFDSLLSSLETAPVTLGKGRPPLTASGVIGFVQEDLYSEQKWPAIEDTLGLLFREVPASANGASRSAPAKANLIAPAVTGSGNDEMSGSFQAIECLTVPADQRTVAAAERAGQEAQTVAPHFGPTVAEQWLECAKWPVPSPPAAGRAISAAGTPTILLVNNSYDPATPLSWATAVHGQLANSVLVTNTAGGHGFYPMGACTHNVVDTFLISGGKPAPGTACHDKNPVLAPPSS